jgi:predicted esterase
MIESRRRRGLGRVPCGVALLGILGALSACSRKAVTTFFWSSPDPEVTEPEPDAPLSSPWCGEGFRAIDEATCVAVPEHLSSPASLVVYAHGMIAPDALPTQEQATLLAAAQTHGFAVLFVHGKAGLCNWEPSVADHVCWPTQQATVDEEGPKILAGWAEAQKKAEAAAGTRFEKRYAFGFSNGGYWVAHLALEGHFPIDGAGVVGAGRTTIDEASLGQAHPPLYLAVGEDEAAITRTDAANLARVLTAHEWPVHYVVHAGRGHELHEDDLAGAWAAWGR